MMMGDCGGAGSGVGVGVGTGVGSGSSGVVVHPLMQAISRQRVMSIGRAVFMRAYIIYYLYKYSDLQEEQYL